MKGKTNDERLADAVYASWEAFWAAVQKAEEAGLHVSTHPASRFLRPKVERTF